MEYLNPDNAGFSLARPGPDCIDDRYQIHRRDAHTPLGGSRE